MPLSARSWRFISYASRSWTRIYASHTRCWSPSSHPPAGAEAALPLRDISLELTARGGQTTHYRHHVAEATATLQRACGQAEALSERWSTDFGSPPIRPGR